MPKYPRDQKTYFGIPRDFLGWIILGGAAVAIFSFFLGMYYGYGQGYRAAQEETNEKKVTEEEQPSEVAQSQPQANVDTDTERFEAVITQKDFGETTSVESSDDLEDTQVSPSPNTETSPETPSSEPTVNRERFRTAGGITQGDETAGNQQQGNDESPDESTEPADGFEQDEETNQITSDTGPRFTIQVLSSRNRERTLRRKRELVNKGYKAVITEARIEGDTWYRLRVGQFVTESKAQASAETMKKNGVIGDYWISSFLPE